jgi:hypothetical protein
VLVPAGLAARGGGDDRRRDLEPAEPRHGAPSVATPWRECYLFLMTLEELADLIRANSANTNGRIDSLRNEANAALMNIQNDLTDVRGDIKDIRQNLDLASTVAAMRREIATLAAEVAELKRRAS